MASAPEGMPPITTRRDGVRSRRYATDHNSPARFDHGHGLAHCLCGPGRFKHHVHAPALGQLAYPGHRVRPIRLEDGARSQPLCRCQTLGFEVSGIGLGGAAEPCDLQGEQSYGPAAQDGHRIAGSQPGQIDGVNGDTQWLQHRSVGKVHGVGHWENQFGWVGEVLHQAPSQRRRAHELDLRADVRMSLQTELTVTAVNCRLYGHACAHRRAVHARPEGSDHARELMSQLMRFGHFGYPDSPVVEVVNVRAADTHRTHPNEQLTFNRFRARHRFHPHVASSVQSSSSHPLPHQSTTRMAGLATA